MFIQILQALIAIPKIGDLIRQIIDGIMSFRDEQLRKDLENAAIQIKASTTKEERRAAVGRWSDVISR